MGRTWAELRVDWALARAARAERMKVRVKSMVAGGSSECGGFSICLLSRGA